MILGELQDSESDLVWPRWYCWLLQAHPRMHLTPLYAGSKEVEVTSSFCLLQAFWNRCCERYWRVAPYYVPQRANAALRAIALRCFAVRDVMRALALAWPAF